METKKTTADAGEFCLVLTPTWGAARRAGDAVRERFSSLPEKTRNDLADVVAELVQNSVARGSGGPITVAVAMGAESIRGEVADHADLVRFETPLEAAAQARSRI